MKTTVFVAILVLSGFATAVEGQSLRGSHSSIMRMERERLLHDYSILENGPMVRRFADSGLLVRLTGGESYRLYKVTYPYVRPEVKLFVERLSRQYMASKNCGRKLVITGATRTVALNNKLSNSSDLSVHRAGMAVDIRVSSKRGCRKFLEDVAKKLEGQKLIEATREHGKPHYHVAVFPEYKSYVERLARKKGTYAHK